MSRTRQSPMDRAVAAFAELSADEQATFLLAARFAGKMTVEPPAPRKRTPRKQAAANLREIEA